MTLRFMPRERYTITADFSSAVLIRGEIVIQGRTVVTEIVPVHVIVIGNYLVVRLGIPRKQSPDPVDQIIG
jgi:hypothetical protein